MKLLSTTAASALVLFCHQNLALATEFRPLATCNNRELVIDKVVDTTSENAGRLQIVINGKLPIETLLFPSTGLDESLQQLKISFFNEGNTLVISDLFGATRNGPFVHIYEGAGYYPFQTLSTFNSLRDLEYIGDKAIRRLPSFDDTQPNIVVNFFFESPSRGGTGIGGHNPIRNNNALQVNLGRNSYNFYDCSSF
jgi:hypothetical protein